MSKKRTKVNVIDVSEWLLDLSWVDCHR